MNLKTIAGLPDGYKLEAKIDEDSNTIHLQAPSVFIRDWIESNYKTYIEKASLENGLRVTEIITQSAIPNLAHTTYVSHLFCY